MKQAPSRLLVAAALSSVALTTVSHAQPKPDTPARPKLVVVMVMDQFRADYLNRYAKYFSKDGFNRLVRRGANLTQAHYSHATTYTGPGHAQILSGSFGHTNGIVGNRWYNPASKKVETMFFDPEATLPGIELSFKDDDTSPRNFIGNNLGDQLRLSNNFKSKTIGIAVKDRAAIMLAGKLGKAYWFHEKAGAFITSSYYAKDMPQWVKQFNARKIPDSYYGKTWSKSLPEAEYSISRADDFAYETDLEHMGKAFPHTLTDPSGKPADNFYTAFTATPFSVDYTLQMAKAAIESEELGADEYPDILGVSITATDIAGHAYGPDSAEVQDLIARTDGMLADFFEYLDKRFKKGELVIAMTADHGATPLPEHMKSLGIEAGRIKKKQLDEAMTVALNAKYGAPDGGASWFLTLEDPGVFLNPTVIAAKKLDKAEVQRLAGEAALTVKGIAAYFTREQLTTGQLPPNKWASMFEKAFHHERSGDVLLLTKPFYFWGSYGERDSGSTHGSPYEYDTHVPMLFQGFGIRPGQYATKVDVTDFAPTLANILGVNPPAGNEGRVLNEILAN